MTKAHVARAVAVLALAAGLTGCGGEDGTGKGGDTRARPGATPPVRAVQDAYRKTVAADTARMTVTTRVVAEGQALTAHGGGVADLRDGTSRVTLTSQGTTVEQRVVDGVVYQKPSGGRGGSVPGGKTWMKIDLARLTRQGSAGRSQVTDPAEPVRYLKHIGSGDVTRLGTRTVDGTRTTHYRVSVPVSALSRGDKGQEQELRRQLGKSSLPVDLWLDERGRLRQESVRLALRPLKQRTPGKEDTTVTSTTVLRFTDYGTAVDVTAPPAGDTADVTDRMARAAAG
ncbi:putative lipoprotein [Streptomyces lucensis JCM 4490]|uniref:Lipoprotein n=1 Tax=Streptomyces lucensis JCM 4490 TaxID=1306176 RepID=A0A918MR06_9ACTN|nr:hypothetical protein [Streptomyces lucensis]GGW47742.1 putative lipoprotein [Streptomyces lucensis JCM 4490]